MWTPLSAAAIQAHFAPASSWIIGREIQVHREVGSTNDLARAAGKASAPEGLVVFAETQTAGRGRLGRVWQSPPGLGLWFSILLRPAFPDYSILSLAAALAVARGIDFPGCARAGLKWPNDVYLGGKKVAGILCEASGFLVVGIGLNVNQDVPDLDPAIASRATSLALQRGEILDRTRIAARILMAFGEIYAALPAGAGEVVEACAERSILLGKTVRVGMGEQFVTGEVTGLDLHGGLRLETETGPQTVSSGEATVFEIGGRKL